MGDVGRALLLSRNADNPGPPRASLPLTNNRDCVMLGPPQQRAAQHVRRPPLLDGGSGY